MNSCVYENSIMMREHMNTLDILMERAKRFIDVLIVVNISPRGREILQSNFYDFFCFNLSLHHFREVVGSDKT